MGEGIPLRKEETEEMDLDPGRERFKLGDSFQTGRTDYFFERGNFS